MPDFLQIKDLSVQYNTDDAIVYALSGVDLSLQRGETLGLVGETGAGKTTLALSIMRLLPDKVGKVTQGNIFLEGTDLLELSEKEMQKLRGRKISMIFQDPMTSLNPTKTVGVQIREVLDLHFPKLSHREKQERVNQLLQMVGIPPERQHEFPFQFSGGMKQRIVIAMALISEPELLLADEPTTALDVTIQAQILELMNALKKEFGTSMILITHDLGVVLEVCSTVAVIYSGQVIETGTVQDVFKKEKNHPYTEGLFKCIPDLTTEAPRLIPIPGQMPDPSETIVGCRFCDRCQYRMEICAKQEPAFYTQGTHSIRCHLYQERGEE